MMQRNDVVKPDKWRQYGSDGTLPRGSARTIDQGGSFQAQDATHRRVGRIPALSAEDIAPQTELSVWGLRSSVVAQCGVSSNHVQRANRNRRQSQTSMIAGKYRSHSLCAECVVARCT